MGNVKNQFAINVNPCVTNCPALANETISKDQVVDIDSYLEYKRQHGKVFKSPEQEKKRYF